MSMANSKEETALPISSLQPTCGEAAPCVGREGDPAALAVEVGVDGGLVPIFVACRPGAKVHGAGTPCAEIKTGTDLALSHQVRPLQQGMTQLTTSAC
ncbi:hypothetical protein CHELA20_52239 [Hyphomicrobiales bacterium]|nr:hypothetical protein CHELA41_22681 [Hyphomicrobiales bacterium]CAH1681269.1 hypothetical protein CHELA20_52239 [Hyphomicrobiales bacterium]